MPARRPHEVSDLQELAAVAEALLYAAERFQSSQLQSLRESFGRLGALTKLLIFRNQLQSPRPCTTPLSASKATSCSRRERAFASSAPSRSLWSSGTSCSRRGLALRRRALPEQPAAAVERELLPARRLHGASALQVPATVAEACSAPPSASRATSRSRCERVFTTSPHLPSCWRKLRGSRLPREAGLAHDSPSTGTSGSDSQKHPRWHGSLDPGCTRAAAAASTAASAEEANLRSAEAAGATPQHLRADSPRSLKDRRAATAGTSS